MVRLIDGHPASLSWLGGVRGHRVRPLGVEHFGQSGDLPNLYRHLACGGAPGAIRQSPSAEESAVEESEESA